MDLAATVFSSGWASGVNAYATVLVLGLLGRAGVGEVPDELTKEPILIGAGVMYAIEFVTDKVPLLDNTWDLIHTAIRPAIGSLLGIEFSDADQAASTMDDVLAGGGAGATSLTSHAVKSSLRLGINASPEPFSNIITSLAEDAAVIGVTALAVEHPVEAAVIAGILLILGIALVILIWSQIRKAWRRRQERRRDRERGPPP